MGPNQDMWRLIRVLDGRKPPAKPAEPLQRPALPGCLAPARQAITDREKVNGPLPGLRRGLAHADRQDGGPANQAGGARRGEWLRLRWPAHRHVQPLLDGRTGRSSKQD